MENKERAENKKEDLNNKKSWFNKMVEVIKENQYRIFIVLIMAGFMGLLIYYFITNNTFSDFKSLLNNPLNYVLIIAGYLMIKWSSPHIQAIWKQTDIRDETEEITLLIKKQELEQLKLQNKKLELEINKINQDLKKNE